MSECCKSRDLIAEKPPVQKSEIHLAVEQYIGKRYEIFLVDGRIVRGFMIATDKNANMIFNRADERWIQNAERQPRYLGQAMIAKKHVQSMRFCPLKESDI